MKSILFVCTGNIFRSVIAEYALKAFLKPNTNYFIYSAGTEAKPQAMSPFVLNRLMDLGINPRQHRQQKIKPILADHASLVVAMGVDHREYLRTEFNCDARLFNQICYNKEEPIRDGWEVVPDWQINESALGAYLVSVVNYIVEATPYFASNAERYLKQSAAERSGPFDSK